MRPTPIPDNEVPSGSIRRVLGAPSGDLDDPHIAPVETLIGFGNLGPVVSVRCVLEPGDLELLAAGGTVWLHCLGSLVPFHLDVKAKVPT